MNISSNKHYNRERPLKQSAVRMRPGCLRIPAAVRPGNAPVHELRQLRARLAMDALFKSASHGGIVHPRVCGQIQIALLAYMSSKHTSALHYSASQSWIQWFRSVMCRCRWIANVSCHSFELVRLFGPNFECSPLPFTLGNSRLLVITAVFL